MTPIFSRIWLVKTQQVRAFEIREVSLRRAALINRACAPTVVSPISPSNSALVTSAATESTTITSSAFERMSVSQMRSASSPELGCETNKSSRLTPSFLAYCGSSACSTSINAARPPRFCACDHGQRKRGFAGGFRTENFDHTTAGKSADAERAINQNVPGRNNVDIDYFFV